MSIEPTRTTERESAPADSTKYPYGDIFIGLLFLTFAILMFVGASFFPHRSSMGFVTAARFTPMMVAVLVGVLALVLIVHSYRTVSSAMSYAQWLRLVISDDRTRRFVVLAGITGIYVLMVGVLPFVIINVVFFAAIYSYLRIGGIVRILAVSILNAAVVAYVVPRIFQMPLP